jgi:hypothetical protein
MNKDLNYLKQLTSELGKEIDRVAAELGEEIKRLEEAPKPWPQDGDDFFILGFGGHIMLLVVAPNIIQDVNKAIAQGNGFRTRAEAEAEKHYRDVAYKLSQQEGTRKFIKHECNWCLHWCANDGLCKSVRYVATDGNFAVYFDTKQQAKNAIAAVGEQEIIRAIRWKELGETS